MAEKNNEQIKNNNEVSEETLENVSGGYMRKTHTVSCRNCGKKFVTYSGGSSDLCPECTQINANKTSDKDPFIPV